MARNQVRLALASSSIESGSPFGDTGPYELLKGQATFAIDPSEMGLPFVCDLDLAPRNADGSVEFSADVEIVKPVDPRRGNGRLLLEVPNRGTRRLFELFNDGPPRGTDPYVPGYTGNGYLQKKGYTIVWLGFQGDLVSNGKNLVASLPEARENGQPLRGRVGQEFIVDRSGVLSMPVSGDPTIRCYPVLDRATATLTVREREQDERSSVPAGDWDLLRAESKGTDVTLVPSRTDLYISGGFKPGWIYELIYETEGSRVMNLGLLGMRDLVSFLRYVPVDAAGVPNPVAGHIAKAYAFGSSFPGRVLREFVWEGWNEDVEGRPIFDAIQTNSASGRTFFNQRFAQAGRFPRQHEEHWWASERYPFTFNSVPDPFGGKSDGLWKRPQTDPWYVGTHTSTEYWNRHISLGHTDPRDGEDVEIPARVRMYYVTGTPHTPGAGDNALYAPNMRRLKDVLRACLELLDGWATEGLEPPPSLLPRRDEGGLVRPEQVMSAFPQIPRVTPPTVYSRLPHFHYGPDFDRGRLTVIPPDAIPGREYPIQVPAVNVDGNELHGLRYPDIEVPLGTYTGWNVRKPSHGGGELAGINGSFFPFARTQAEREASGDPRLSIEERYPSHEYYVQAVAECCERLTAARLLLEADAQRYVAAAQARNPLDPSVPLGPLLS